MNRRNFISGASLTSLSLLANSNAKPSEKIQTKQRDIIVFSKSLEKLPFPELANVIAPLGVEGLEAPLRRGGHIQPAELADKLPSFVEALSKKQLKALIIATSINKVDKAGLTEKQLRAAAASGIKKYRPAHLRYDLSKAIKPQLASFKDQLKDLAQLNKELGIQAIYQNHRGKNYLGASIWDIVSIVEDINISELALAFDFAHATVEGSNAWQINFMRALPHIGAVFMKDYKVAGKKWIPCALGDGMVNPRAGKLITKLLPKEIPISVHVEYKKRKPQADFLAALKTDVKTLRSWL